MQFEVFEPDIEVNGPTVYSIIAGLGYFTNLSRRYFSQVHIGTVVNRELRIDMNGWYPQSAWLEAFKHISAQVGDRVLFSIGLSIPANAQFPPWVVDIDSAVKAIDVAYHLNHRKRGKVLLDVKSGVMSEGIGHYGYARVSGERKIISVSHNPYPCAFDRGIITAMAHKFEPSAMVVHDDTKECRSHGAIPAPIPLPGEQVLEQPCGKLRAALIRGMIDVLVSSKEPDYGITYELKALLVRISGAQIDRLLVRARKARGCQEAEQAEAV